MKNKVDFIESVYFRFLAKGRVFNKDSFPKNFSDYKYLRKCDPETLKEYIRILESEKNKIEKELKQEDLQNYRIAFLKEFSISISEIISLYNSVNEVNKRWSEAYAEEKEEDSTACETKQSSEEVSVVKIIHPSRNDYIYFEAVPYEEHTIVQEEYSDPMPLSAGWWSFFTCCGCNFF